MKINVSINNTDTKEMYPFLYEESGKSRGITSFQYGITHKELVGLSRKIKREITTKKPSGYTWADLSKDELQILYNKIVKLLKETSWKKPQ